MVSIGPLTLGRDVIEIFADGFDEEEENEPIEVSDVQLPGYFIYALMGCLIVVVALLAAIIVLSYKRKKNSKVEKNPKSSNNFKILPKNL